MLVGVAVVAALTLGGNDDNSSLAADANAEPVIESEPSSTTTTTTESAPEPSSTTTTTTEVPGLPLISGAFADQEIYVFVSNHDVAEDLRAHTPEFFTANGGATVNFVMLYERTTREVVVAAPLIARPVADVVMLGSFETPAVCRK